MSSPKGEPNFTETNGEHHTNMKPNGQDEQRDIQIEMVDVVDQKYLRHVNENRNVKGVHGANCPALCSMEASSLLDIKQISEDTKCKDDDDKESVFDAEVDDLDRFHEAWVEANPAEKVVLFIQRSAGRILRFINQMSKGNLLLCVFLLCFTAYLVAAMVHRFGDEGSHRLLVFTVFAIVIWSFPRLERLIVAAARKIYGANKLSENHKAMWMKLKTVIRWVMYVVMLGVIVYVCVDQGRREPSSLRSLSGLFVFLLVSFLFSTRPSKIHWHTIFWSMALQFAFACFVLKWKFGRSAIVWLQDRFSEFFKNGEKGSELVFGDSYRDHLMIFGAVPLFLFSNAVFTLLYYLGVMQFIIKCIGKTLKFFLHATHVETMAVSATIFLEGIATMIMMRPFLRKLSKSEMFTVINGSMSSLGAGYLAILATFGISIEYLIPAMLISAPATFAICKLMVPEVRDIDDENEDDANKITSEEKTKYLNGADAVQAGALSMLPVMGNVVVVAYTFFTFMTWINHTLGWFGDRVGIRDLSVELISSYVLYPVSWLMGVESDDCRCVAMLLGYRLGVYNIVAYLKLTEMKINRFKYLQYMLATNYTGTITKHRDDITLDLWNMTLTNGYITEKSEAVATYALAGFSSGLSGALMMGVIYTLVPARRRWITKIVVPAIVAGNLANCMTGCFASMFY